MLDSYIQGFQEASRLVNEHYDALPMQNNANRFKHGNRCPQGEYWVQPPGQKGFCRKIGKRKGGTGRIKGGMLQRAGSGFKSGLRYSIGQNKLAPNQKKSVGKGVAAGIMIAGGGLALAGGAMALKQRGERRQHEKELNKGWSEIRQSQKEGLGKIAEMRNRLIEQG